jgi:hypothetical protein
MSHQPRIYEGRRICSPVVSDRQQEQKPNRHQRPRSRVLAAKAEEAARLIRQNPGILQRDVFRRLGVRNRNAEAFMQRIDSLGFLFMDDSEGARRTRLYMGRDVWDQVMEEIEG